MKTFLIATIALFAVAGCAGKAPVDTSVQQRTASTPTTVNASAQPTRAIASSGDDTGYQYIIGPGDTLDVFVWGYEDLSVTVPVRPDGKITTRLVEDMQASGKTPTVLARDIEAKYVTYVKNPTVTVTVNEFVGSPSQQIKVVGGGSQPKTVLIEVGGLSEFSSGNKAVLVRNIEGKQQSYKVRLSDLLERGDINANRPVQPGDIIIIPESWF